MCFSVILYVPYASFKLKRFQLRYLIKNIKTDCPELVIDFRIKIGNMDKSLWIVKTIQTINKQLLKVSIPGRNHGFMFYQLNKIIIMQVNKNIVKFSKHPWEVIRQNIFQKNFILKYKIFYC